MGCSLCCQLDNGAFEIHTDISRAQKDLILNGSEAGVRTPKFAAGLPNMGMFLKHSPLHCDRTRVQFCTHSAFKQLIC